MKLQKYPKLLILIPAFNEETMIRSVLKSLPKKLPSLTLDVVVVNDGSTDKTALYVQKIKRVTLLSHVINRGLGGALGTGFTYAKRQGYDFVITFDADGQHSVKDIPRVLEPLLAKKADVIIGSRLLRSKGMPITRKVVNFLSNIVTFALFGIWTTDSQSGLRGFSKRAIEKITLKTQGMEVSSEVFREIQRHRLSKREVPIKAIYTHYSLRKGQQISNAGNILWKLFIDRFSFA